MKRLAATIIALLSTAAPHTYADCGFFHTRVCNGTCPAGYFSMQGNLVGTTVWGTYNTCSYASCPDIQAEEFAVFLSYYDCDNVYQQYAFYICCNT